MHESWTLGFEPCRWIERPSWPHHSMTGKIMTCAWHDASLLHTIVISKGHIQPYLHHVVKCTLRTDKSRWGGERERCTWPVEVNGKLFMFCLKSLINWLWIGTCMTPTQLGILHLTMLMPLVYFGCLIGHLEVCLSCKTYTKNQTIKITLDHSKNKYMYGSFHKECNAFC